MDKAEHQLGVLSLLLRFDKYNFKRSSQTALAGRLHNEHNNSPPPGSSSLVHLPLQSAAMSACAHVSLFHSEPLGGSPPSAPYRTDVWGEPFGPHFLQGKRTPLPLLPPICPSHVMPDWPQHPLKRSKGRQNSLVSWQPVCHQPEWVRVKEGELNELSVKPQRMLDYVQRRVCATCKLEHTHNVHS